MPHASRRNLCIFAVALYLLAVGGIFAFIWHKTGGHFCYALDDTYIHMALATQLSHGHYGINATEFSSPSSSFLWPFLLVPFADKPLHLYLPLAWNLLAGIASAIIIGVAVSEWPLAPQERDARAFRWVAVVALLLTANLIGITFLGMEHGLQILLAICCAFGICRVLSGQVLPPWCIVAAAVAPCLRYEDLALTVAIAITLYGLGRRRSALLLMAIAIAPLIAFSIFLYSHGLPPLPLSVLVKGKVATVHTNVAFMALRTPAAGLFNALTDTRRWPILLLFLILIAAARRESQRPRRFALAGAALAAALQLLIGRFDWLHRYEVYALVFSAVIVLRLLQEYPLPRLGWYAMGLASLVAPYAQAVSESALSAEDVYGQQYQMHRFANDYYWGNVGVVDLGKVSYQLDPKRYVLDLGGLASVEAARESNKSPSWFAEIVRRHDVGLVMGVPLQPPPVGWTELGTSCLARQPIVMSPCVVFTSTKSSETPELKKRFAAFAATLPSQTEVRFAAQ